MKKFFDRLPRAISAKQEHAKRQGAHTYEITARLLDAILGQGDLDAISLVRESTRNAVRRAPIAADSRAGRAASDRLRADLAEVRTFAVERIKKVSVQEGTFESISELDADPFKNPFTRE